MVPSDYSFLILLLLVVLPVFLFIKWLNRH